MNERRVTDEELSALFESGVPAAEPASGLPVHVVPPLAALAERLFVGAFLDLDDFLDIPLEAGAPRVASTPASDLLRLTKGGAWAPLTWTGRLQGRSWLVLPEVSVRRLLARLLGSREDQVKGVLGRLHRTSLEAPIDEVRSALGRHLEDEGLSVVVRHEPPSFEPPEAPEVERLVRLECPFEMRDASLEVEFFLEEELALALAEIEQERWDAAAAEEAEAADEAEPEPEAEDAPEVPAPDAGATGAAEEREADEPARPAEESTGSARTAPPREEPRVGEPEESAPDAAAPEEAEAAPGRIDPERSCVLQACLGQVGLAGGLAGLEEGMLLRLDRAAGDLVELRVAGQVVGEARVTVVDGNYGLEVRRLDAPGGRS